MAADGADDFARLADGAASSFDRLAAHLDDLAAAGTLDLAAPSLLPSWSVGAVLGHLASAGDSYVRMLGRAAAGDDVVEQYPGGAAGRAGEIVAGAGRPLAVALTELRRSEAGVRAAFTVPPVPAARGRAVSGALIRLTDLPLLRWREVEVHHADLGLAGFTSADWSAEYVRRDLGVLEMRWRAKQPMGAPRLPAAILALDERQRLAWLLGRHELPGVAPAGVLA